MVRSIKIRSVPIFITLILGAKLAADKFGDHEYKLWFGVEPYPGFLNVINSSEESIQSDCGSLMAFKTFEQLSSSGVAVVELIHRINHPSNQTMLRQMHPDVIFSARFLHIFKEDTISIPKYGVWNMHPGALPGYRGLHCDMQAMMAGEANVAMTFHIIDGGIDTGKIMGEALVPIEPTESLFMHRIRLHLGGMNLFFKEVMRIIAYENEGLVTQAGLDHIAHNPADEGRYFSWPEESDYQRFDDLGLIHCCDSDIEFIKGLFDRRLVVDSAAPTICQDENGLFYVSR